MDTSNDLKVGNVTVLSDQKTATGTYYYQQPMTHRGVCQSCGRCGCCGQYEEVKSGRQKAKKGGHGQCRECGACRCCRAYTWANPTITYTSS